MLALVLSFVFVGTGPEALPIDDHEEHNQELKRDNKPDGESPGLSSSPRLTPRRLSWRREIFNVLNTRIIVGGILVGGTVALMHYCQSSQYCGFFSPNGGAENTRLTALI